MTTIGTTSRPAYVYDAQTDTWIPVGVGPHSHDNYIDKALIDAKGDIFVGTAADTVGKLGVGEDGTFLKADSSSATGLVWEALDSGSISVSETAPAEPGEGDLWFNSTNATTYIYYDDFWIELSPAVAGPRGEPGIIVQDSAPTETDALWLDSDDTAALVGVPSGGLAGQVLVKSTNSDYETAWTSQPSRNVLINGAFDFWQRGTSFTLTSSAYHADRWLASRSGSSTITATREAFAANEINATGFGDAGFYLKYAVTSSAAFNSLSQKIEDVRTLAGQAVTISFWAKGVSPGTGLHFGYLQNYGTGGSPQNSNSGQVNFGSLSSEWTRYSYTFTIPSVSDKIIGENSSLDIRIGQRGGDTSTASWELNIWGVQLEAGSVATPFRRNANSFQGELAACQRYYWRQPATTITTPYGMGLTTSTTAHAILIRNPVTMRTSPSSIEFLNLMVTDGATNFTPSSIALAEANPDVLQINTAVTGATQFRPVWMRANVTTNAFFAASAEL
jgi:hypothetical protein